MAEKLDFGPGLPFVDRDARDARDVAAIGVGDREIVGFIRGGNTCLRWANVPPNNAAAET